MTLPPAVDPRIRTALFGLGSAALAVWIGSTIGQGEMAWAMLAAGLTLWLVAAWVDSRLVETWFLAFLVFAYILGSRGFAQITPVRGLPFFFGELGLVVTGVMVVFRCAITRRVPLEKNWFNGILILLLASGGGRILFDVRTYGFVALRDFATLYYALFFFIAQAVCTPPVAHAALYGAITLTFGLLPLTSTLTELFPDFFLQNLVIDGVPLFYYKGDLLATFQLAGFVWLLPGRGGSWRRDWWRWPLATLSLVFGLANLSRAGMVGLGAALAWLILARSYRHAAAFGAVCLVGGLTVTLATLCQDKSLTDTKVFAIVEHLESIADFSGTKQYSSKDAADSGDNNRFRLVWWKTVTAETAGNAPLLGFGFGYDLARGFLLAYDPLMESDFTARSPHSIVVTMFGRMGLLGLLLWLAFMSLLVRRTQLAARAFRAQDTESNRRHLTLLAICWVILVSACFGVVLEGPMGAIPFWIMLGASPPPGDEATPAVAPAAKEVGGQPATAGVACALRVGAPRRRPRPRRRKCSPS